MTYLNKVKYIPLSNYNADNDPEDTICAVDVTTLFGNGTFPDWSKAIAMSSGTTYKVGTAALGYYRAGYLWFSGGRGGWRAADINGVRFLGGWDFEDGHEGKLIFCPLSLDDTVVCHNGWERLFIPIAGGV